MFSPTAFLVSSFAFAALLITAVTSWQTKNPEQILFIVTRCMEDWYPKAKAPETTLQNWKQWKLEPSDEEATQCYTKCILEKIGFYESEKKRFEGDRAFQQFDVFHRFLNANYDKVNGLKKMFEQIGTLASSNCADVFNAYKDVHAKYLDTIQALLFGDRDSAKMFYEDKKEKVKQKNQTLFLHCETLNYRIEESPRDREELCKVRKYGMGYGRGFENHMECLFKGLRYMNSKNELDVGEIARDFELVKKNPDAMKATMETCKTELKEKDSGKIAIYFYQCLLNDTKISEDFKEAFDYREIRSQDYFGLLTGKPVPYNKEEVAEKIKLINKEICPKPKQPNQEK